MRVAQERFDLEASGAHWEFPERQPEKWPRESPAEGFSPHPKVSFGDAQACPACTKYIQGKSSRCPRIQSSMKKM